MTERMMPTLRTECPRCGHWDGHRVGLTYRRKYHLGPELKPFFERILGRDVSFRLHTRVCEARHEQFVAAEVAYPYLDALKNEIQRLTDDNVKLRLEVAQAKDRNAQLQNAVNRAERILSSVVIRPYRQR
jgi:hypothetical protein